MTTQAAKSDKRLKRDIESPVVVPDAAMLSIFRPDPVEPKKDVQLVVKMTSDKKDEFFTLCEEIGVDPSTVIRRFVEYANSQMRDILGVGK